MRDRWLAVSFLPLLTWAVATSFSSGPTKVVFCSETITIAGRAITNLTTEPISPHVQSKGRALHNPPHEMQQLVDRMQEAIQRKDAATLDRILSQDFINVGQSGEVVQKTQFIRLIMASNGEELITKPVDLEARVYGNVAVVTYRSEITGMIIGDSSGQTRVTDILVRHQREWRFVSSQQTPILRTNQADARR